MNRNAFWNFLERLYGQDRDPNTFMQLLAVNGQAPGVETPEVMAVTRYFNRISAILRTELGAMTFKPYNFNDLMLEKGQMRACGTNATVSNAEFYGRFTQDLCDAANDNLGAKPAAPSKAA